MEEKITYTTKQNWWVYVYAFVITLGVFLTAVLFSRYITNQKLAVIRETQDSIAIDIMSSETQFSLLSELSCKDVGQSTLTQELNSIAEKIDYSVNNIGNREDVIQLKEYYTLLEIKDFLLMRKISDRCGKKITSILYVYTTEDNCRECTRQGYVLTALRQKYPDLRVYSFDYNLDLSALNALLSIYKVEDTKLPAVIINEKMYTGFHSIEEIETKIPDVVKAQQEKEKEAERENTGAPAEEPKTR